MIQYSEIESRARAALAEHGLIPQNYIEADKMVYCRCEDGADPTAGRYILHTDTPPTVWICNHYRHDAEGVSVPLLHAGESDGMTDAERDQLRKEIAENKARREQETAERHAEVAKQVRADLKRMKAATDSTGYLARKGVHAVAGLKEDSQGRLVIPAYDASGEVVTMQTVPTKGDKMFRKDGKSKDTFFPVDRRKDGPLYLGEGIATMLTVYEATGAATLSCFSADHLLGVAKLAREKYPDREIVITADNDTTRTDKNGVVHRRPPEDNVGRIKAMAAAEAIGARCVICPELNESSTDFNDLAQAKGLDAVRQALQVTEAINDDETPIPLRKPTKAQSPFPVAALGDFAQTVVDVAFHSKDPQSVVAGCMMAELSLLCQGIANVITPSFVTPLSLFFMAIMKTGEGKSTIDGIFKRPILEYTRQMVEQDKMCLDEYEIQKEAYDRELANLKRKIKGRLEYVNELRKLKKTEPKRPVMHNCILSDVNYEGIYAHFRDETPILGIITDEGASLFGGVGFSPENAKRFIGAATSAWSGESISKGRGVEGSSVLFDRRLMISIMVQPYIASTDAFGSQLLLDQGFLPRFLTTSQETSSRKGADRVDYFKLDSVQRYLKACEPLIEILRNIKTTPDGGLILDKIDVSDPAYNLYLEFKDQCDDWKFDKYDAVPGFAARGAEQALRIAGILCLAHDASCRMIDLHTMECGITIAEWFLEEVNRIVDDESTPPEILNAERILKWLKENGIKITNSTQLIEHGPGIRDAEKARAVLKTLAENYWIKPIPGKVEVRSGDKVVLSKKAFKVSDELFR